MKESIEQIESLVDGDDKPRSDKEIAIQFLKQHFPQPVTTHLESTLRVNVLEKLKARIRGVFRQRKSA
jgi:hypothetical protein